jgi:tetratricopeptide (TPR) repeat protein
MLETIRTYATALVHDAREDLVTVGRHATWCAQLVRRCDTEHSSAARRLHDEHSNLLAALDELSAGGSQVDHGELVLGLYWSLWDWTGQWQLASSQLQRYVQRTDRDRVLEGRCMAALGLVSTKLGDYPEARSYAADAVAIAKEIDDSKSHCQGVNTLGEVAWQTGDLREAQVHLEEALVLSRSSGDRPNELWALSELGNVGIDQGDFSRARVFLEEALAIARERGDQRLVANLLGNLGAVASCSGDFVECRARYEEALSLARESGARRDEQAAVGFLGEIAICLGDHAEARERCEEALAISREIGDRQFEATWVGLLGEAAHGLGHLDEARTRFEEALSMLRQLGARQNEARWLRDLGNVATELAEYSEAKARYLEALSVVRDLDIRDIALVETCAEFLARLGHLEDAATLLAATDAFSIVDHVTRNPADQTGYEEALDICRAGLEQGVISAASERGRSLDWSSTVILTAASIELARDSGADIPPTS